MGKDLVDLTREATRIAKATSKVVAFVRDDPSSTGRGFGDFGRGYAHSALWAHYGDGHSGVCLVFDRDALSGAMKAALLPQGRLYAGTVTYEDAGSDEIDAFSLFHPDIEQHGLEAAVEAHIDKWHPVLFFRKSREWENEREYRWLLRSPVPAAAFVPIVGALRGLALGHDFPRTDLDSVDYLAKRYAGLSVGTCRWDNGVPKMHPHGGPPGAVMFNSRFWPAGATRPLPPPSLEVVGGRRPIRRRVRSAYVFLGRAISKVRRTR